MFELELPPPSDIFYYRPPNSETHLELAQALDELFQRVADLEKEVKELRSLKETSK